jgi:protein ImuB
VALLHSLGVWRIEQLEALPRRELSSRFGPELLDCLDRVTGRLSEPLPAWDPPPQFAVSWSAEFPTARRETLEAALEHLVRRLAAMLIQAGRGVMRLECLLKCVAGRGTCEAGQLQVAVGLFRPSAWANHLVELLQVRFESLQLPGPVDSIGLTAAATAPLELRQQELFSEGQTRVDSHHLSGLIDRLSNRLGHTCVMRVRLIPDAQPELACHYLPLVLKGSDLFLRADSRRVGASRRARQIDLTPLFRPLRLLTQPVRLPGGIDGSFSFAGQQQRIVRRLGPERIETGWWRGRTVARDYYRIETATGRWYWVFQRLPCGPWFLHGMFD